MRQLVHELRTPTNAIAGFAELIGTELLGPVPAVHRERADVIVRQAGRLAAAIDDLDAAARVDGGGLELRPGAVPLAPLVDRIAAELSPVAARRGVAVAVRLDGAVPVWADDRMLERVLARSLAIMLAATSPGDDLTIGPVSMTADVATLSMARSRPVASQPGGPSDQSDDDDAPLLGIDFTQRLARDLAVALGGELRFATDRATLRLPTALHQPSDRPATT